VGEEEGYGTVGGGIATGCWRGRVEGGDG